MSKKVKQFTFKTIGYTFGLTLLLGGTAASAEPGANTLPTGGQIVNGNGNISQNGNVLTVNQNTNQMITNWNTFNVGSNATVQFNQPGANSTALNRILDSNPSQIFGQINANGKVFLLNPNGILFGSSAQVDVGSLVASGMDISDDNFMQGNYQFVGGNAIGTITNDGRIVTAEGGVVAFIGSSVINNGTIETTKGTTALVAGDIVTLDFVGDGLINIQVDSSTLKGNVTNSGDISADGGMVILSADASDRAMAGVVNNSGIIQANSLVERDGKIVLEAGYVENSGTLDVSSETTSGGKIVVTGDQVMIDADSNLDATGAAGGGEIYVGGGWQGGDPEIYQATGVFVDEAAVLDASATDNGDGGTVVVWSDVTNEDSTTRVYGTIKATGGENGGNGGLVETSGHWFDIGQAPDTSAPAGEGGTWLIDPHDIDIVAGAGNTNINAGSPFESTDSSSLGIDLINTALGSGDVIIRTGAGGSILSGDITWSVAYDYAGALDRTLTLQAHRSIILEENISSSNGALSLVLTSDISGNDIGCVAVGGDLTTAGGNITFNGVGTIFNGSSGQVITTAGGNVDFNGEVMIANPNGLTITTSNGNVTFDAFVDSGNSYSHSSTNRTWSSAAALYEVGSGTQTGNTYLATVTTSLENSAIINASGGKQGWLGANDTLNEGTMRWVMGPEGAENGGSGRVFWTNADGASAKGYNGNNNEYVFWRNSEPNNSSGNEDYVELDTFSNNWWNDLGSSNISGSYIETNLAVSPLTIDAGNGAVTFSGAVGTHKALGAVNISAATISITGDFTLEGDLDIDSQGDFTLAGNIIKNGGSDATVTIQADDSILINSNSSISSTNNKLNTVLWSDSDTTNGGIIWMKPGSSITSNGGNVSLGGGADDGSNGGTASDGTPDGFAQGISSTASYTHGVWFQEATINSGGGDVTVRGKGAATGNVVDASGVDGSMGINAWASSGDAFNLDSGTGKINIYGVAQETTGLNSQAVVMQNGKITSANTQADAITIVGDASATNNSGWALGVDLHNTIQTTAGGGIDITGTGGTSSGANTAYGIIGFGDAHILSNSGAIVLTGTAGSAPSGNYDIIQPGFIGQKAGTDVTSSSSDITLNANTISFLGTDRLASSGILTIQPRTATTTIGIAGGAGTLALTAANFSTNFTDGFANIIVGGANAGLVTVGSNALSYNDDLIIKTDESIFFDASASVTSNGNDLTLWTRAAGNNVADDANLGSVWMPVGSSVNTGGGNIVIGGGVDPTVGYALGDNGAPSSENNARYRGVTINGTLNAAGGDIVINGRGVASGSARGVSIGGTVSTTGSGDITLAGVSNGASDPVALGDVFFNPDEDGVVSAVDGTVTITGTKDSGTKAINLSTAGSYISTSGSGDVVLTSVAGNIQGAGYITVGGATTLTAATSDNITLNNSSNDYTGAVTVVSGNDVSLRDANAMVLGASTITGDLTLVTAGAITQTGALDANGSTSVTAGSGNNVTLNNSGNDYTGAVTIVSGNDVSLRDANAMELGASTISGDLTLVTAGAITQTGALDANGATSITADSGNNITLNNSGNDYTGAVTIVSGNDVSLRDTNAMALAASTISGDLTIVTAGAITQTGALDANGTTSVTAGSGNNVTLNNSGNDYTGAVTIVSGNDVSLRDANAMELGASTISGDITLVTDGAITQAGALDVTGTTGITSGSGNVVLTNSGNDFTGTVFSTSGAAAISVTDTDDLTIGSLENFTGDLNLTAGGILLLSGNILKSTGGDATATFKSTGSVILNTNVQIVSSNNMLNTVIWSDSDNNESGGIKIRDGASITSNGGDITLGGGSDPLADFAVGTEATLTSGSDNMGVYIVTSNSNIQAGGGDISIRGKGGPGATTANGCGVVGRCNWGVITRGTFNTTGTGTITIVGEGGGGNNIDNYGVWNNTTIETDSGAISITGTGGTNGSSGNHGVYSNGEIRSDSGAISITGTAGAGSSDGVNINEAIGKGGLASSSSDITITTDSLNLDTNASLQSTGSLIIKPETGAATIGIAGGAGTLSLTAGEIGKFADGFSSITVGSANSGAIIIGANATFNDDLNLINNSTIAINGVLTVNDNLALTSAGAITQTLWFDINGTTSITAGSGNNVTLDSSSNDFTGNVSVVSGNDVSLRDTNAFAIDVFNISGDLTVVADGAITQVGALDINGITSITAGSNDITLTNSGNDFTGAVTIVSGNDVGLTDTNLINLGVIALTGDLDVTSEGDLYIIGNIARNGAGDATLTFLADGDIYASGKNITSSNKTDITFNTDRDDDGDGAVRLRSESLISTTGGFFKAYGGSSGTGYAVGGGSKDEGFYLDGKITTAGGDVEIKGKGISSGGAGVVIDDNSVVNAGGGSITIIGQGVKDSGIEMTSATGTAASPGTQVKTSGTGTITLTGTVENNGANSSSNEFGIKLGATGTVGALIQSDDGKITINGTGGNFSPGDNTDETTVAGVQISGSKINTTDDGNIDIDGVAPTANAGDGGDRDGVSVDDSTTITTNNAVSGAGGITIDGTAYGRGEGVDLENTNDNYIRSGAGGVSITGSNANGNSDGIQLSGTIQALNGNITLVGNGGTGSDLGSGGNGIYANDLVLGVSSTVDIFITGTARSGNGDGIYFDTTESDVRTANSGGSITVNGTGFGGGSGFESYNIDVDAGSGGISVTGDGGATGDGVQLWDNADIRATNGNVTVIGTGGATSGDGVYIDSDTASVQIRTSTSGNIAITGNSTGSDGVESEAANSNKTIINPSGGGTLIINGTTAANSTGNAGIELQDIQLSSSGNVTMTGQDGGGDSLGIDLSEGGTMLWSVSADITVRADAADFSGTSNVFTSADLITIAPITDTTTIGLRDSGADLNIARLSDFIVSNNPRVQIGENTNTGGITIGTDQLVYNNLHLVQGSGNVEINAELGINGSTKYVSIDTTGNVTDGASGYIESANVVFLGNGATYTLDHASNRATTLAANTGSVTFNELNSLTIGTVNGTNGIATSGDFTLTTNGALTQTQALDINGATSITSGSGNNITLDNASNDFTGAVTVVSGNDVSLRDANAMALGASTISGDLTLVTAGAITQTGALDVNGATSVAAGSGNNITLNNSGNDFTGAVTVVSGNDVSLRDTSAVVLGNSSITHDFTLVADGAITQTDAVYVGNVSNITAGSGNNITLENSGNDFNGYISIVSGNDVSLRDSNSLSIEAPAISGSLTLVSGGNISQSGAGGLAVNGTTSLTAGSNGIYFQDDQNDFTGAVTVVSAGLTRLADANAMTIGGVTSTGVVEVVTKSGDLTVAGDITTTDTSSSAITLNAGRDTAAGTSTGGELIISGTPTISTGAGGRATLYTGSISGSTGLTTHVGSGSGDFRYNSDETTTNYSTALSSGSYAIYREQPTITITASDDTVTYDATTYSGGNGVTSSGYQNGDTSAILTGTVNYGGTSQGAENAGAYTISASNLANGLGYALSYANGELTVNTAAIILATSNVSKTYDGNTTASGTAIVTSGSLYGTDSLSGGTFTFDNKNVGTNKTVTTSGVTVSDGNSGNNYTVTYADNSTSTINQKVIGISSSSSANKIYDGNTTATITAGSLTGVVGGDTVTVSGAGTFDNKNVGSNKDVTTAYTLAGTDSGNYSLAGETLQADISQKGIAIFGSSSANKVYDGNTTATITAGSLAGVVGGDTVTVSGAGTFDNKNVGTNKDVTTTYTLAGTDGGNYSLADETLQADISQKGIAISGSSSANKVYDGNTTATITAGSLAGVVGGDTVTVSGAGTFDNKNVGTDKDVTTTYALAGTDGGNYSLAGETLQADVSQKGIAISGSSSANKVYDGNTTATITAGSLAGVVGGDTVTVSGAGVFDNKNVGTDKDVATTYALAGTDSENYSLAGETLQADVTQKTIAISGSSSANKVYDGNTTATITEGSLAGVVGGDTVTVSGAGTFDNKNVGANKDVTTTYALAGTDGGNYSLAGETLQADVTAKSITTTGITADNKVYDATTVASINTGSATLAGVVGGDTVSLDFSSTSGAFADKNVGVGKAVTVSGVALSGVDSANYTVTDGSAASADITAKTVTLTGVTGADKVYDGNTTATVSSYGSLSGVIGGDSITLNSSGSTANFADKNVGNNKVITVASLSLSGIDGGNYNIGNQQTMSDVTPKPLTVIGVTASNKYYDGNTSATLNGGDLSGVVSGDQVTFNNQTGTFADQNTAIDIAVTVTGTTLGGSSASNYTVTDPAGLSADINQRPITVDVNDASKLEGYDDPALTYSVGGMGLVGEESLNGSLTRETGEVADDYAILQGTLDNSNYAITYTPGTFTIAHNAANDVKPIPDDALAGPKASSNNFGETPEIITTSADIVEVDTGGLEHPIRFEYTDNTITLGVDQSGQTTTQTESSGTTQVEIPVFKDIGEGVVLSGGADIIDSGSSVSLTPTAGSFTVVPEVGKPTVNSATTEFILPNQKETKITVTMTDTGVLIVTVDHDLFNAFDENRVVLLGIKLAKERLNIELHELKGVLVYKK